MELALCTYVSPYLVHKYENWKAGLIFPRPDVPAWGVKYFVYCTTGLAIISFFVDKQLRGYKVSLSTIIGIEMQQGECPVASSPCECEL